MNLFRSAATVGGLTMISRVLGFVRDMAIAAILGTGPVADAFVVAFRFPNFFRRFFGEGAFNAAFVPLFAKRLETEGEESARNFAVEALSVLFVALLVFTALAEISMPFLIHLIAPGFADTPDKLAITLTFTAVAFPYLMFMSLVALYSGLLNSLGRFAAAAAAPIVLNIVLVGVLLAARLAGVAPVEKIGLALCWGVSAAGFLQLGLLLVAARRAGFVLALKRPRLTPGVRRLVRLGVPGVIAGGITQVNLLVGTIIATFKDGAVSYLYYADRIYQLPLGVVGIAIGVALLPDLSRKLAGRDMAGAADSQNRAFEYSMLLTLPAAAALVAMPQPVIQVLFERGAFSADATSQTAQALAAFALGLPAFVLIKVFSPGFFAREDTKTPMIFAGIAVVANIAGSLLLFPLIAHVGIAAATTFAGWLNAGLLWATLTRRGQFAFDARSLRRVPFILLASVVMGLGVWYGAALLAPQFTGATPLGVRAAVLAGLVAAGAAVFFAVAQFTGAARLGELLGALRRPSRAGGTT